MTSFGMVFFTFGALLGYFLGGDGGSQGLFSLIPTTVMVVLLLGLWLLLGCDNTLCVSSVDPASNWSTTSYILSDTAKLLFDSILKEVTTFGCIDLWDGGHGPPWEKSQQGKYLIRAFQVTIF